MKQLDKREHLKKLMKTYTQTRIVAEYLRFENRCWRKKCNKINSHDCDITLIYVFQFRLHAQQQKQSKIL